MFIVKNDTFHVTWGDRGSFDITFQDYTFSANDEVELNVYEEDSMDAEPILNKKVVVSTAADTVTMNLSSTDTQLGDPSNERTTFWYEIILNGEQTPFCFDENGPKLFYVYPGGVE